jgi:Fe-S cluster assembly protein SufD
MDMEKMENNIINTNGSGAFFKDLYKANLDQLRVGYPDYVNAVRENAMRNFELLGIPNKKVEKYKYTNLEPFFSKTFNYHFSPKTITFNFDDVFRCDVPDLDTNVITLLNGFFYESQNNVKNLAKGVIVCSFQKASREYPEIIEKHYSKYAGIQNDGLVALNTAFVSDGVFIYVPKNVIIDKPIQIINLLLSQEEIMVQHRNLFVIEENAQANFVICDHTLSPHTYLTNSVTEVYAGPNAQFDLSRMQNEHNGSTQVTNTYVHQMADSKVRTNTITLHGGVVRNNHNVDLTGPGAENEAFGLYLTDHGQHVDNYVNINHLAPNCISTQLYKGVLDDFSYGAFNGRIYVDRVAQKTLAYQTNRNLLLTDDAKANSKPQLEIFADDVKCSHGATVGQLDQDAMFYMRSRGIQDDEARMLLMNAFTNEVTHQIKIPALRERIEGLVDKRLRGEMSRCNNCALHCC